MNIDHYFFGHKERMLFIREKQIPYIPQKFIECLIAGNSFTIVGKVMNVAFSLSDIKQVEFEGKLLYTRLYKTPTHFLNKEDDTDDTGAPYYFIVYLEPYLDDMIIYK